MPSSVGRMSRRPSATSPWTQLDERLGRRQHGAEARVGRRDPMGDDGEGAHVQGILRDRRRKGRAVGQAVAGPFRFRNPCGRERGLASGLIPSSLCVCGPSKRVAWGQAASRPGSRGGSRAWSATPRAGRSPCDGPGLALRHGDHRRTRAEARASRTASSSRRSTARISSRASSPRPTTTRRHRSLLHAGITLRRRVENGLSRWQLKLPARRLRARGDRGARRAGRAAARPEQAADAHRLRHGAIEPVATLRTRRDGVRVADGVRPLADVTLDVVDVLDAGRATAHFVEIEVELVEGDEGDLKRLGRILRRAGRQALRGHAEADARARRRRGAGAGRQCPRARARAPRCSWSS